MHNNSIILPDVGLGVSVVVTLAVVVGGGSVGGLILVIVMITLLTGPAPQALIATTVIL